MTAVFKAECLLRKAWLGTNAKKAHAKHEHGFLILELQIIKNDLPFVGCIIVEQFRVFDFEPGFSIHDISEFRTGTVNNICIGIKP
jgi:hypothetical protein